MNFIDPVFFVLAPLCAFAWVGPFAAKDRRHAAIRSAAWLLAVIALARPVRSVLEEAEYRVVVVDRSASVSDAADAAVETALAKIIEAEAADQVMWSVIEVAPGTRAAFSLPAGVRSGLVGGAGATPLGVALEGALRMIPEWASRAGITIITDGLVTDDMHGAHDVLAREQLTKRGIPVDLVAVGPIEGDLRAVALDRVGPEPRVGRVMAVTAHLLGGGQVVNCVLSSPAGELARVDGVQVDGDIQISMTFTPAEAGWLALTLNVEVVDGVDPRGGDLTYERTIVVDAPLVVQYRGSRMKFGSQRLQDLLGPGFAVVNDFNGAASSVARQAEGESRFPFGSSPSLDKGAKEEERTPDVVFLDDLPASAFSGDSQERLAKSIRNGGVGLVAAGGEASFGPGGYHNEPIEELLPVEFVQKEEKRDPSTTLVVIIDTSGSMGGNRVQLAKEVSRLAIRRLLPHDKVGMVEFYGAKRWAVPIQPASNSIEIERALNRLDAGGGTVILPAIEEAYYGLKNVRTRFKHVLILTDGGVETGAFEPLLRRMADDGMNVSTVLIGPDAHSEFLVSIANWGQGRFYSVPNRFNLPEILLKQPASAKLPAYRPGMVNVKAQGGPTWWGDLNLDDVPPLDGYVETRNRPGATTLIETADEGHPILSTWRYGAGRVTALTTEPFGPGTEAWSDWAGYGELLGRVIERTAADDNDRLRCRLVQDVGGARLIVEDTTPAPRTSDTAPCVALRQQEFGPVPIRLGRVALGRWEASIPFRGDTDLRVSIAAPDLNGLISLDDYAGITPVEPLQLVLNARTGSARELQIAPEAAEILRQRLGLEGAPTPLAEFRSVRTAELPGPVRSRLSELAPLFALLALLTYLLDVAYRRWPRTAVRN